MKIKIEVITDKNEFWRKKNENVRITSKIILVETKLSSVSIAYQKVIQITQ